MSAPNFKFPQPRFRGQPPVSLDRLFVEHNRLGIIRGPFKSRRAADWAKQRIERGAPDMIGTLAVTDGTGPQPIVGNK